MEICTTEMHTGGEPVRIVESGYPIVQGATLLDKRQYAEKELDRWRKLVMWEPRGHRDMYGVLLVQPDLSDAHIATLFLHNAGYSTMCGHAVIAIARYAVDRAIVPPTSPNTCVNIQCPCGLVKAWVDRETSYVRFHSVPAFVFASDLKIELPSYGSCVVDVVYGGAFYAIVNSSLLGLTVDKQHYAQLVKAGSDITEAVKRSLVLSHPDSPQLAFLYGTIITDGNDESCLTPTKNICIFAAEEVDRSPTGSGVTARVALQYKRKQIAINEERIFESITGSKFGGKMVGETKCGLFDAVIVEVGGKANYMGNCKFTLEGDDPFPEGFLLQ